VQKTFYIRTFGCQMNLADTEKIVGMLEDAGYSRVECEGDAEILLLNTCAVRQKSENKVYSIIGRWKQKYPDKVVGVLGCVAQEAGEAILDRFENVSLVLGTVGEWKIVDVLNEVYRGKRVVDVKLHGDIPEGVRAHRDSSFKAWVNIIYGCNKFCTYCIVPYTRGRERSRKPGEILKEVEELVRDGYKEITLLGQNVNSYGKDLPYEYSFARLLKDVDSIVSDGVWIRYTTSYPRDFDDELILVIASSKHVCRNFHLPLQSGSNRILRTMNRGYTIEQYRTLVEKIKSVFPRIGLTTDLIVGFPGEGDEDFDLTLDAVREFEFDMGFTAMYSPRPGTVAARMDGQLPNGVKRCRLRRLNQLLAETSLKNNRKRVGRVERVLVDGIAPKHGGMLQGRTEENIAVVFHGDEKLIGDFVSVRLLEAHSFYIIGELEV